nr:non-structural protein 3a [Swine enteric coronavirus]
MCSDVFQHTIDTVVKDVSKSVNLSLDVTHKIQSIKFYKTIKERL